MFCLLRILTTPLEKRKDGKNMKKFRRWNYKKPMRARQNLWVSRADFARFNKLGLRQASNLIPKY